MMTSAAALTVAELSASLAAIGGFEARPAIAVAVSGGPDSLALTILADRWTRERDGHVTALTVDHRLRPESADEARTVGEWLEARGIEHHVLVWDDAKRKTGIQEAARKARYRLLAQWCSRHGRLHLLTAHHREDQIETYLIRKRAGSGVDGLAGMSAVREMTGLRLVRPLLTVPKARLLALLEAEGQPFLSDPSNRDPAYERVRVRRHRIDEACAASLAAEVRDYGRQRVEREQELDRLLASAVSLHPAGFAAIDPALLARIDTELVERLLGRVALCVGGAAYPLRRERVARLRAGLAERPERARTLGGCRFVPWRGRLLVIRELAAAAPPVPVAAAECLWDRRFVVTASRTAMPGIVLGYLGQFETAGRERGLAKRPERDLPRVLHPVLPVLWSGSGLIAAPHLGYFRTRAETLPTIAWHPVNPLSRTGFTVV